MIDHTQFAEEATVLGDRVTNLEGRVTNLEGQATGNLTRKAIPAPVVTYDDATKLSTVAESEAKMEGYIYYNGVPPSPATVSGYGSGSFHHADWSFRYSLEAAKHLDVSAIHLHGSNNIESAVLQSSAPKSGDGGFTAEFLLQDGTNDITVEIDATPDGFYEGQLQFVYDWTITNNGANSYNANIFAVTGITVLEHEATETGVEVYFDFGGEEFGGLDDFELEAYVTGAELGIEGEEMNGFAGTITGAKRSNQAVVTFRLVGRDADVFSLFPPLVVPTEWDGNIAALSFFSPNIGGEEIWDLVRLVADNMVFSSAIKNEVQEATP